MNRWINVHDRLPEEDELVLTAVTGRDKNIEWEEAYLLARFYSEEGWVLEEYPEAENFRITWWMPLPDDVPEGDSVKTNADRIRSMSDEECAEWISNHVSNVCGIVCGGVCDAINSLEKSADQICKEKILNWLKAPCKED